MCLTGKALLRSHRSSLTFRQIVSMISRMFRSRVRKAISLILSSIPKTEKWRCLLRKAKDKHEFIFTYIADIGDGQLTAVSGKVRIPVTQGAVKSRISSKSVYSNMIRTQKEKFDVTLYNKAGNEVDIDKIELVNPNSDFELIKEGAQYYIGYTPNGAVKRGRSYTLKLNVYPKGKATNTKPVRLTYKVSVAK